MEDSNKYSNILIQYNIWMSNPEGEYILGDDTFKLLTGIKEKGSLSASAKDCNVSYRKAWGDLKECEQLLGFPLIVKIRGGKNGGQTTLTEEGVRLLDAYKKLQNDFQQSVNDIIVDFKKTIKGKK